MDKFNTLFDYLRHVRCRPNEMLGVVSYSRLNYFIAGFKYCLFIFEDVIGNDESCSVHLFFTKFDEFLRSRLSERETQTWSFTALLVACVQPENRTPCEIKDPELDEKVFYKFFELYDEFLKQNENNKPEWYI